MVKRWNVGIGVRRREIGRRLEMAFEQEVVLVLQKMGNVMVGIVFEVRIVEMGIFQINFIVFKDLQWLFEAVGYLFVYIVYVGGLYIELL